LALLASVSAKHHAPSATTLPSAPLPLPLLDDTSSTSPVVIGGTMKVFYIPWLTNLKFSENKHEFPRKKIVHNKRKSLISSKKQAINFVNTIPNRISKYRVLAQLWSCHVRKDMG